MSGELFIEAYASTCGNGFGTSETSVPIMDLLSPDVVDLIRQRVQTRCDEVLARRAARTSASKFAPVRPDRPSHLYLMQSNGLYKIGVGTSVESRRKALATASGYPVTVVAYWPLASADAFRLESLWHRHFERARMAGEWFNLSLDDVLGMLQAMGGTP